MLNATLTDSLIDDLLHLRMPEAETMDFLETLQPERLTGTDLQRLLACMQKLAVSIPALAQPVMDCCGTGGSGRPHFNTSTSVAFVLAAGGVPVVKFGNRAASSASGSFDFLATLGFPAEIPLAWMPDLLSACGLVFLYAPQCYPVLAPFNRLRRAMGQRTVFNFLGPLLNPVCPAYRLLGVSNAGMQDHLADCLKAQNPDRAWVVFGEHGAPNGLDEIAIDGQTRVLDISAGQHDERVLAHAYGGHAPTEYTPEDNVRLFRQILNGEQTDAGAYHMICLNAGAGFVVAGKVDSLEAGYAHAADLIAGGKVRETLENCRRAYARIID